MAVEDYITIPELPEATSLQNADLLPIRDSLNGIDKKLTYANLQAQIVALFRDFASIYDNAKSYKLNAVVEDIATGILYKSLVDSNLFSLTDTSKWKRLGDLSLIEEYLTTSNIANKYLKLNLNGLIDNTLLKNQYIYLDIEVNIDSNNGYKIYKKADGTIERIEQWGVNNAPNSSSATYSFHIPFNSTPSGFGGGRTQGVGSIDGNNDGMYPISATQFVVFSDQDLHVVAWRAWGK